MAKGLTSLAGAAQAVRRAKSVLLSCHERPDGDALGSCLGLAAALRKAGRKAVVVNVSDVPGNLRYLPGSEKLLKEPPAKACFDLAVTTDSGDISRLAWDLGKLRAEGRVGKILNLDHHKDNTRFGDLNYLDLKASSTGEVAYDVIRAAKLPLDRNVALNLFTAIVTDTGSFRYSNTSYKTMRAATELMRFKIEAFQVTEALEMSFPKERVEMLGKVLSTLEVDPRGRWAVLFADQAVLSAPGARYDLLDEFTNFPRSIGSVEVAGLFKEVSPGKWRVSLRSKRYLDVGALANSFGGGGHKFAAGLPVEGTKAEVRLKVLEKIETELARHA